jgi:DNA-binding transcriptional ArsR family regulator
MSKSKPKLRRDDSIKTKQLGRYAYDGLVRILHERARLGIMASLAAHHDGLLFNDLKRLCNLTDGNLSRHLATLNEAGLVEFWETDDGPRQQTLITASTAGLRQFADYISELEQVLRDAQKTQSPSFHKSAFKTGLNHS